MDIRYKVVVLFLIFVQALFVCGQRRNPCWTCGCCASGRSTKCTKHVCHNGCIDGYSGRFCYQKCSSERCVKCHQANRNYCLECKLGFYGSRCKDCGKHCANCNFTGCQSCVDGYWKETCTQECREHCLTCNKRDGKCTSCKPGYHGYLCDSRCDDRCLKCDEWNGDCIACESKFWGNKCIACGNYCKTCNQSHGCLECNFGRYGETCSNLCSFGCELGNCMRGTGTCSCKPGWTGQRCDICMDGYYGNYCKYRCHSNCESCKGHVDCQSCITGKFGDGCQSTCQDGCLNDICDKSDGSCHSCKEGFYGSFCNNKCPNQCQICDQNGHCLTCKSGFSNIHKQCSCRTDMCNTLPECTSCKISSFFVDNGVCCQCGLSECLSCSKRNGTIICSVCNQGLYSTNHGLCMECNSNCIEHACNSSSGKCLRGCKDGFWKESCDKECVPECLSCNHADGSCSQCKSNSKYGPNCNSYCKTTCNNSLCYINGDCMDGCVNNYFGNRCENRCDEHCLSAVGSTICSERTGMCLYGCELGYKGVFCPEVIETNVKQASSAAALVGGVGGGVVALAVIVIVGLLLLRRRIIILRNKSKTHGNEPENLSPLYATINTNRAFRAEYANDDTNDTGNVHSVTIENSTYQNPSPKSSGKEETPILTDNLEVDADDVSARAITPMFETNEVVYYNNTREVRKCKLMVADLPEYVQTIFIKELEEEFQQVPYGLVKPYKVSQTKFNMHRNRYKGIYPYDDTRVVVREGDTDYINASYIDGFRKRNAYIATLGPMAKQLGDFGQFWRMVWQQKVEKIVMVTNLVECEKTKCEQYWPDHGQSKLYGDIEVVCKVEKMYADFICRQFTFSKGKQNSDERNLHHLQFTAWPDKDIPDNVTSILEFRQKVNALPSTFDGPVIVHCSAGVGRTGTYIALDILIKEGEAEGSIDIPGCVLKMRQNRPSMIQTLSQYKYLHEALVHSLTLDCSLIKREHFHEYMHMMSSKQEIQKQFEKMELNQERKSEQELQAMERNRLLTKENRKYADIPGDSNRPRLYLFLKPGESDYINAIYINSFKTKDRFLVAQTPLADTVSDFVALAVQENCSCIVSMEAQGIGLYVPGDNLSMMKGVISIRSARDQSSRHFVKRKLHFKPDEKAKPEKRIPHYEYLDWDRNDDTPKSAEHFVAFIKEVEDASKSSHLNGPILVHCMNGSCKSGLLCVVSTLLETLSEDNEVSVVNAVRKVRARRPPSIPNKEQFFFCYECVLQYLNATNEAVYYNTSADIKRK